MLSRRRDRPPAEADDTGFTLIELLVSMTLMSMVGAMALTFFVGSSHETSNATDSSRTTAKARFAMSTMVGLLDVADSLTTAGAADGRFVSTTPAGAATAKAITFYSNDNNNRTGSTARTAPDRITLDTSSDRLVEQVFHPLDPTALIGTYPSAPNTTRVLIDNLTSTSSGFAFCSDQVDSSGVCVPTASLTAIATVNIMLVLPGQPGVPTQTLTSTAAITGDFQ